MSDLKGIPIFAGGVFLACFIQTFAGTANATFRVEFLADQVVRTWFIEQDGAKVYDILSPLTSQEIRELAFHVDQSAFVREVKRHRYGSFRVKLYNNLKKTFQDTEYQNKHP